MKLAREDGATVARLELADRFFSRLRGLMLRPGLAPDAGLWIEPCSSIHMMFVRFPIDVVFVRRAPGPLAGGAQAEVLAVRERVRPWLGTAWCRGATSALELPAGRAQELGLAAGDRLSLVEEVAA
ncbi:MAG: DUF192 domain-containing protein [Planctomycetota bacterium]